MLGEQLDAVVELEGEVLEQEPWVRRRERELDGQVVDCADRSDVLLHVGGIREFEVALEQVEGELDVTRGEWLPVTPLHTLADVDREAGEVLGVGVAGGQPRDHLVGEGRVVEQALPQGGVANLVRCAWRVRVADARVAELPAAAAADNLERPVTRDIRGRALSRGDARFHPAQASRHGGHGPHGSRPQYGLACVPAFHAELTLPPSLHHDAQCGSLGHRFIP